MRVSAAQRALIGAIAIVLVAWWPPPNGRSLAITTTRWLADPGDRLPSLPEPLPMGLGDDGDAVAEQDRRLQEYYAFVEGSSLNRLRLRMKEAEDPLAPATARPLLIILGIVGLLGVWQLNAHRGSNVVGSSSSRSPH